MIGTTFQFTWEVELIEWCQNYMPQFLIEFLKSISFIGDVIFCVGVLAFVYLCYDKKAGKFALINTIMCLMLSGFVKNIFLRRRPYFDNENIKCLKVVVKEYDMYDIRKQGFSFPSMHSANISTISGSLASYYKSKSLLVITIVASLIVGISRFVLGCHYPTDVIFGWLTGIFSIFVFGKLQNKLSNKAFNILGIIIILIGFTFCTSSDFYSASGIFIGYIFCTYLDEKYIHFENTRNIIKIILRLLFACGTFLLVSVILKMPVPVGILEADNLLGFVLRLLRYALSTIIGIGLTPMLYKYNIFKLKD